MTIYASFRTCPYKITFPRQIGMMFALIAVLFVTDVLAEAQATPTANVPGLSAEALDRLVGPIALYPDDLVAIILPASTFPLQIVQADRFIQNRKANPKLAVDEKWDAAVKSLLNYPDVVKKMSAELDWTTALGDAVATDQSAVLEAIQVFRRKTKSVDNLKSDDKQTVIIEKEVIKIVPADPQVIYVPQYNPSTVIVTGGYSSWGYWPSPYPVYYYPYPPGSAFAAGLVWGAAINAAWNGGHYHADYHGGNANINIDRSTNINTGDINSGNVNKVNRSGNSNQVSAAGTTQQWQPNKAGEANRARSASPTGAGYNVPNNGAAAGARPSTQPNSGERSGGGAFGDYGSGRQTQMDSSRGAASRGSMSGASAGQMSRGGSFGGGRSGRGGRR